ncbi:MAG: hypothetical protein H7099_04790 [Gemmatimonadaceae bacterium]|nr:hypothetical protein [Gemmatimonadaceae bacterium]
MSDRTEGLTRRAVEERQHLTEVFDALEAEVDELTDWRAYVRREPITALAVAAMSGALIGAVSAPRRRRVTAATKSSPRSSGLMREMEGVRSRVSSVMLRHVGSLLLDALAVRALAKYKSARKPRRDAAQVRRRREPPAEDQP